MDEDNPYEICVSEEPDATSGINPEQIKTAVAEALREHGCATASLSVAMVSDACIAELNQRYLEHQGPTDVLSFDLSQPANNKRLEGEIILSWETAARQAEERGHSTEAEAVLYAVHGALHLLGFDDHTDTNASAMHAEENRILCLLGYGRVFGEV